MQRLRPGSSFTRLAFSARQQSFQALGPHTTAQTVHALPPAWPQQSVQRLYSSPSTVGASSSAVTDKAETKGNQPAWTIEMLYDGDCPLCMREVNSLRKANGAGNINFVDIASKDYNPSEHANIDFEEAMGKIHAIRRDGQVVTNVEAFKQLYEAAGRGWVYSFANIGPLRWLADKTYDVWAKYRLQVTGRPNLASVMEQKKTCR